MQLVTHKFSVEAYHRMGETGILPPDKKFELIRGEIIKVSSVSCQHAAAVKRTTALFYQKFSAVISVHDPILLGEKSETQPDIILLKLENTFYGSRFPVAADALLLIEIADSTLQYDRTIKIPLYAENQIPEVWIANIQDQQLEIYRSPQNSTYTQKLILKDAETIAPLAFPEIEIAVKNILG